MNTAAMSSWLGCMRWWLLGVLPLVALSADEAQAKRGLTVDDLMRTALVGRSGLDPSGRLFIYEFVDRYDAAVNFGSIEALPEPLTGAWARLYAMDLETRAAAAPLFEQDPGTGYMLGGFSPDGKHVAVYRLRDGNFQAGVVNLRDRRARWFDFIPNNSRQFDGGLLWISPTELVHTTRDPGSPAATLGQQSMALRAQHLWGKAFEGKQPSTTVLRSVADAARVDGAYRDGGLVRVDVTSGRVAELARGLFINLRLSPDGRFLAGLRETGRLQHGATQLGEAWLRSTTRELVVFDLHSGGSLVVPVKGGDVLLGTPNWSPVGNRLTFLSRDAVLSDGEVKQDIFLAQYIAETGILHDFDLSGLQPEGLDVAGPWSFRLHLADLGEKTVGLLASRQADDRSNPRWYLWQGAGPWSPLPEGAPARSVAIVGVGPGHWYALRDGVLFKYHRDGHLERIDTGGAAPLQNWSRSEGNPSLPTNMPLAIGGPLATATVALDGSDRLVLLDPGSGKLTSLAKSPGGGALRAMAMGKARAVMSVRTEGVLQFAMTDGSGITPLFELNTWVRSLAHPKEVTLTYPASDGSTLSACLLLPPDWQPGQRLPLVVYVYPDVERGVNRSRPGVFGAWNFELLPARGFALLVVPTPRRLARTAEGPLKGLTPLVLAGVDAAVKEGYVDPDRIGLLGLSQGMHAVLQIATETKRIRTVVAGMGISDFTSEYLTKSLRFRLDPDHLVVGGAGRFEHESSSNFLGPKPWENPQRYIDNSPVFFTNRIACPVLLIHSDLDYFSNAQSEAMFSALHRLKKDAEFVVYWGEGHTLSSPANIRDLWDRLFAWYGKHLAPRELSPSR